MQKPESPPEKPGKPSLVWTKKWSRRGFFRFGVFATPLTALAESFWMEPEWIKVKHVHLNGAGKSTHRIVHFTDIHHKGDREYLAKAVRKINSLKPDLVCFTGDIIEESRHLPEALEVLRLVEAPMYGVPGNHDYWADADFASISRCFAATGGQWLMDQQTRSRDGKVNIVGVTCAKPPMFNLEGGRTNILLMHYPSWVERIPDKCFDLILAGHSHGGQVRLPFYGALLVPSGVGAMEMGLYRTPSGPIYVNPGLGYFFANVRFCCRPELTVIEV